MYCGKCGAFIPDGDVFCRKCGASISDSDNLTSNEPVTQQVQAAPVTLVVQPLQERSSNGMGIAGLILGIFSLIPYIGLPLGALGLIFSIVGLTKKNAGKGTAIAGLVLSIIGLLFSSVLFLGTDSYLKKAQAANASSIEASRREEEAKSLVNSEVNAFMGWS